MVSNNSQNNVTKKMKKLEKAGLTKLPIGLASVALGTSLYLGATNVHADTQTVNTTPAENQTDDSATLPGTPTSATAEKATTNNATESSSQSAQLGTSVSTSETAISAGATPTQSDSTAASQSSSPVKSSSADSSTSASDNANDSVTMTYYVHDDDNNNKVVYKGTATVKKNQTVSVDTLNLPKHYDLVSASSIQSKDQNFIADIHVKHHIVQVATPKATPIERTIIITFPDGSTKTIKQEGTYQTPGSQIDEVTNVSTSTGTATLTGIDSYTVPTVSGYKPNIATIPALTPASYDGGAKLLVNVTYSADSSATNNDSSVTSDSSSVASDSSANLSADSASSATSDSSASSADSNSASSATDSSASSASGDSAPASDSDNTTSSSQAQGATTTSVNSENNSANGSSAAISSSAIPVATASNSSALPANENVSSNDTVSANSSASSDNSELPQTGNQSQSELAALGLGALGVVGTMSLAKSRKKYSD